MAAEIQEDEFEVDKCLEVTGEHRPSSEKTEQPQL